MSLDLEVAKKKQEQGYTKIAEGKSPWIYNMRILTIYAFYHPDGRIATYELHRIRSKGRARVIPAFEDKYTPEEFKDYKSSNRIKLGRKKSLERLIKQIEKKRKKF